MTNRDPNRTEFQKLFMDYNECIKNYFSIPDEQIRLERDLKREDINLVCYYEKSKLNDYMRNNPFALNYHDVVKLDPQTEAHLIKRSKEISHTKI